MDQVFVGAAIQVVLENVLSASIDEIKLVLGFNKELNQLNKSLLIIQDFLSDAEAKQLNNKAVKDWLEELEDLAFEADAVLGECNYELLRKKVKEQKPASNKVLNLLPSGLKNVNFHRKMAHKIDEVNKKLENINNEAIRYGLQAMAHASSSAWFVSTPTDSIAVEPHIVGRDNDESEIVEMLLSAPKDETIFVLPILGMGGLGKTTLARKVFHRVKIKARFEKRIWVYVSTNFDATTLFNMILESLYLESVQVFRTKEVVLEKIRQQLASKRYLLVLDDVWNENPKQWDDFMSSLLGASHGNGNCILVTTRIQSVASLVGTFPVPPHQPHSLSEDDCWSIIKSKAFPREVPAGFEEIGHHIAQRCGGLPLAAKVVGGLLQGKSKKEWQSILEDQLSKFGLDDHDIVMNILKLSYDRLPSSRLKKCFAYCSIFPQDYKIGQSKVIQLWMAEGFLGEADGVKDMETVGVEIFNSLLQNSLFQDAEKDEDGNITFCRMHDLVHDLARTVSGHRTICTENGNSESDGLHQTRYLSTKSIGEVSLAILRQHATSLRTIFFEDKTVEMLSGFKQLHVLKLTSWSIKELPDSIGVLIHLRLLDISETSISYLPDSLGKLYHLQTLSPPPCKHLSNLPRTMVDLISLRHLNVHGGIELPPGMGELTCLQTLPYYTVGSKQGCKIGELGKLKNLKGLLEIQNLERVKDKQEAMQAELLIKANISGLVFKWNHLRDGEINDENVLDGLQPHPCLKSLTIFRYNGRNFPSWTMKMAVHNEIGSPEEVLHNLIKIKLEDCKECEEVPMFGHLPHLKLLELRGLSNVRSLGLSFYGIENSGMSRRTGNVNIREPKAVFPALEKLVLYEMPELSEWAELERKITVFPCLKDLEVERCNNLNSLLSRFPCLEGLTVRYCTKVKSVPSHLPCLRELEVEQCHNLNSLPSSFPCLERLRSRSCAKLKTVPSHLPCLKYLEVEDCNNLNSLPSRFPCLEGLTIIYCTKLKSVPSHLPCLRELEVDDVSSDFCLEDICSRTCNLQSIGISCLPGLICLPDDLFAKNQNLRKLKIAGCHKLMRLVPSSIGGV